MSIAVAPWGGPPSGGPHARAEAGDGWRGGGAGVGAGRGAARGSRPPALPRPGAAGGDPGRGPAVADEPGRQAGPDDAGGAGRGQPVRHHHLPARFGALRRRIGAGPEHAGRLGGHDRQLPGRGAGHPAGHPAAVRHGRGARAQQLVGATIFPHNIGLGATRDPALVREIGRATAEEMVGTGALWNFAPCLCVARNDRWGRTYESFGETPELPSQMTSLIDGLQGSSLDDPASVLATAKHYVGDGGTTGGVDQGDTQVSEAELRAIHLPPFVEAVERGVGSVMISFSSWNGTRLHGHEYLITDVLKGELGFE